MVQAKEISSADEEYGKLGQVPHQEPLDFTKILIDKDIGSAYTISKDAIAESFKLGRSIWGSSRVKTIDDLR